MAEQDESPRGTLKSTADQTLMGVPAPRIDSDPDSRLHSPVLVRAGTSEADAEPAPLPRGMALPSRPPSAPSVSDAHPVVPSEASKKAPGALEYLRQRPVLGMLVLPVVFALLLVALGRHAPKPRASSAASAVTAPGKSEAQAAPSAGPPSLAELEQRAPGSLRASEVLRLAAARAEQKQTAARDLRQKIAANPALGKDSAIDAELLQLAADPLTAPDALHAMSELEGPTGADLLYEVWTRTTDRTDTTDLAHALLYSKDVKPKASPALAVALALRSAETCEDNRALLPKALTDGDRRSQHLLLKLSAKHGCGPKKADDCYACLRDRKDELSATINAVKSRHAPTFATQ